MEQIKDLEVLLSVNTSVEQIKIISKEIITNYDLDLNVNVVSQAFIDFRNLPRAGYFGNKYYGEKVFIIILSTALTKYKRLFTSIMLMPKTKLNIEKTLGLFTTINEKDFFPRLQIVQTGTNANEAFWLYLFVVYPFDVSEFTENVTIIRMFNSITTMSLNSLVKSTKISEQDNTCPETFSCKLCNKVFEELFPHSSNQADGCAAQVYETHIRGYYGSKKYDDCRINFTNGLASIKILTDFEEPLASNKSVDSRELKIGDIVCDDCIDKLIEKGICSIAKNNQRIIS